MAVTQFYMDDPTLKYYLGTAAERGTMSTSGVTIGSKFHESDTHKEYIWNGSGWVIWRLFTVA